MISDIVTEYMVVKKNTPVDTMKKLGIAAAAIMICAALLVLSSYIPTLGAIVIMVGLGALYGGYYLMNNLNLEFEYCVTNDCFDVDKIIARRDRKRLASVRCSSFTDLGKFDPNTTKTDNFATVIRAYDSIDSENLHYFTFHHSTKGNTMVIFNGVEKIMTAMKPFVAPNLRRQVYGA